MITPNSVKRRMKGMMFRLPMMISCPQFEEFIVEYLEGGLTVHERRVFALHLKICRECREYLAAYEASMAAAKQGLASDASSVPVDIPEDLVAAITASIGATEDDGAPSDNS
ncbi:Putative zinc-finger [Octadecabacter temperatus]|uniref:Uncharacterized protein n=1 Tax=Octadecabacter temperatus TaxID=1458307 RepID=A0A0K0Y728_9RHOB|nr:zf-HC2 domain-containing protein [Octadecabacter temperatus]AKS46715.1 hypothetical protein OSB_21760 [Octadecabacter temperatus]SIO19842.1 Putative zinc-finger [Octadecabacter temperatus]